MLIASIDTETTGLFRDRHEMIQIAVTMATPDFRPTGVRFLSYIKPMRLELVDDIAMQVNGLSIQELSESAPTPSQVRMSFMQWKEELFGAELICPLGHNYSFDKGFIESMFKDLYNEIFDYHIRDTQVLAYGLMDAGILKAKSTGLKALTESLKIPLVGHHDAYVDSLAALEVYRKLIALCRD